MIETVDVHMPTLALGEHLIPRENPTCTCVADYSNHCALVVTGVECPATVILGL